VVHASGLPTQQVLTQVVAPLGEVVVRQGDCIAYRGEIPQAHIEYSDDFEVMQIASPADYRTENIAP